MSTTMTMEFIDKDFWDRPVYKCIETGILWKDLANVNSEHHDLHSCFNAFDGEPNSPIGNDIEVVFKTKYEESPYRHNYMMLSMLQSRCEYFLGWGHRNERHLSGDSVETHIKAMKELHDSFPEGHKPQWLTYEKLLEYERQMKNEGEENADAQALGTVVVPEEGTQAVEAEATDNRIDGKEDRQA